MQLPLVILNSSASDPTAGITVATIIIAAVILLIALNYYRPKAIKIPKKLPRQGFSFPIAEVNVHGFHNGLFPVIKLFNDRVEYRILSKTVLKYKDIKFVEIKKYYFGIEFVLLRTKLKLIGSIPKSVGFFTANKENARELARFFNSRIKKQ